MKTHGPLIHQILLIVSPSSMTLCQHPCDICGELLLFLGMEKVWQLQRQISRCCADIFSLHKRGLHERAAVLQLAACGGPWPDQRRHESFLQDHANCSRCDTAEIEREEHRFYFCKGNTTGDPDFVDLVDLVAKTDWILPEARVGLTKPELRSFFL